MEIATPKSNYLISSTDYRLPTNFYLLPYFYTQVFYFAIWKSRLPTQAT